MGTKLNHNRPKFRYEGKSYDYDEIKSFKGKRKKNKPRPYASDKFKMWVVRLTAILKRPEVSPDHRKTLESIWYYLHNHKYLTKAQEDLVEKHRYEYILKNLSKK